MGFIGQKKKFIDLKLSSLLSRVSCYVADFYIMIVTGVTSTLFNEKHQICGQ